MRRRHSVLLTALVVGCASPAEPEPEPQVVQGITGALSLEREALDPGDVNCRYTLEIDGVPDRSAPWLCPDCDQIFRSPLTFVDGSDSCEWGDVDPGPDLFFGWDAEETLYFAPGGYLELAAYGTAVLSGDIAEITVDVVTNSGNWHSTGSGSMDLNRGPDDVRDEWLPPESHRCGWETADSPEYAGDYSATVGEVIPDAVLRDQCDEPVRLHDLSRPLVVVLSVIDDELSCAGCAALASNQAAFEAELAEQGSDVLVVSVMIPSPDEHHRTPEASPLATWAEAKGTSGVVLADRGFGPLLYQAVRDSEHVFYRRPLSWTRTAQSSVLPRSTRGRGIPSRSRPPRCSPRYLDAWRAGHGRVHGA
jgi:hypothetical protein